MQRFLVRAAVVAVAVASAACATAPSPRPADSPPRSAPENLSLETPAPPASVEESGELSLETALALALRAHPDLSLQAAQTEAEEGRGEQAGLLPRPTASLEVEDAFGTDSYGGLDSSQTTLSVNQTIELGGKRAKRRAVARWESRVLAQTHEVERVEVLRSTALAFVRVLAAQRELEFADELERMQEELLDAQAEQIRVGRIPESEAERSRAAVALAEVQGARARGELDRARRELALHLGRDELGFPGVALPLEIPATLPPLEELRTKLEDNALLRREEAGIGLAGASVEREGAGRIPDPELTVGVRRYEESDDEAFVVGVTVPLTLGGHNRGDRRTAEAGRIEAVQRRERMRLRLDAALRADYGRLETVLAEVRTLEGEVLPAATRSFTHSQDGFRLGRFSYLELRQAQDTLLTARRQLFEAKVRFVETWIDIQALTDDFDLESR